MDKIIANMATFPARRDTLRLAVDTVIDQVDQLNLCLNEYENVPAWLSQYSKVAPKIPEADLKDTGKFVFACEPDDNVFLLDDDLAYPPDYVERTLSRRNALPEHIRQRCVVGYHGTIYRRPTVPKFLWNLIRRRQGFGDQVFRQRRVLAYFKTVSDAVYVSQLGTGTVLLKGHQLPQIDYMGGSERRVDVRFARWCQEKSYPQICIPRDDDWLPRVRNHEDSIFGTYTRHAPKTFTREILSFAFRVPFCGQVIENEMPEV